MLIGYEDAKHVSASTVLFLSFHRQFLSRPAVRDRLSSETLDNIADAKALRAACKDLIHPKSHFPSAYSKSKLGIYSAWDAFFRFWSTTLRFSLPYEVRSTAAGLGLFAKRDQKLRAGQTLWGEFLFGELISFPEELHEDKRLSVNSFFSKNTKVEQVFHLLGSLSIVNHVCRGAKLRWSNPLSGGNVVLKAKENCWIRTGQEILVKYRENLHELFATNTDDADHFECVCATHQKKKN